MHSLISLIIDSCKLKCNWVSWDIAKALPYIDKLLTMPESLSGVLLMNNTRQLSKLNANCSFHVRVHQWWFCDLTISSGALGKSCVLHNLHFPVQYVSTASSHDAFFVRFNFCYMGPFNFYRSTSYFRLQSFLLAINSSILHMNESNRWIMMDVRNLHRLIDSAMTVHDRTSMDRQLILPMSFA